MARVAAVTSNTVINSTTFGNALITDYVSQTDTSAQSIASALTLSGAVTLAKSLLRTNIVEKTGAYTATLNDDIIQGDTNGGAFSITLPAAATATGKVYTFIRTGAGVNALTIDGNGAETIDGAATNNTMDAQYDSLTIICDGTEWFIIARKIA